MKYVEFLQNVLISLHENIHEARERKNFADKEELDYIEGKLMAYNEVLAILRMSAKQFGIPSEETGF